MRGLLDSQTSAARTQFFRCLATLFHAGVPLHLSLGLLAEQSDSETMAEVCRAAETRLLAGHSLSNALAAHTEFFSPIHVALLRVGERTGSFPLVLEMLAEHEERSQQLSMRTRKALVYPAFVMVLCLALIFVLPPLLFANLGPLLDPADLNPIASGLLLLSSALRNPYLLVASAVVLAGASYWLPGYLGRHEVRLAIADQLLQVPVVGKTLRTVATVRFCWALELMVRAGVALNTALKPCAEATGNPVFESCITSCERALSEGETLAASLDRLVFFTPLFIAAVAIGEQAGSLPTLLRKTNRLLELDLEHWFERAGALLEPIALAILGVGVGIVAVGTLLPMVSALQTL